MTECGKYGIVRYTAYIVITRRYDLIFTDMNFNYLISATVLIRVKVLINCGLWKEEK